MTEVRSTEGGKDRVLIVDDDRINREILKDILAQKYDVVEATDGESAWRAVEENSNEFECSFSLILSDIVMPGMDGLALIGKVRSDVRTMDIPVIVISGYTGSDQEVSAIQAGATEFISKPFSEQVLLLRAGNYIRDYRDRVLAQTLDPLTGLYNHSVFERRTEAMIRNHRDHDYVLVCLDISKFKFINELFGTDMGNRVLFSVGQRIADLTGKSGTSTRLNTDRFAFCLQQERFDREVVKNLTKHILQDVGLEYDIHANIGSLLIDDDNRDVPLTQLMGRARLALESVQNNPVIYYKEYDASLHERLGLEKELLADFDRLLEEQ